MSDAERSFGHNALQCLLEVAYKDAENLPPHNASKLQRALDEVQEHFHSFSNLYHRVHEEAKILAQVRWTTPTNPFQAVWVAGGNNNTPS